MFLSEGCFSVNTLNDRASIIMCVLAVRLLTHSIELCPSALALGNTLKLGGRPNRIKAVSRGDACNLKVKVNAVFCVAPFRFIHHALQTRRAERIPNFEGKA